MLKKTLIFFIIIVFPLFGQQKGDSLKNEYLSKKVILVDYPVKSIFDSPQTIKLFAPAVENHVDSLLEHYDIKDKTTGAEFYKTLAYANFFGGEYDSALKNIDAAASLRQNLSGRFTEGILLRAAVYTLKETSREDSATYADGFSLYFSDELLLLPWKNVKYNITILRNFIEVVDPKTIYEKIESDFKGEEADGFRNNITLKQASELLELKFFHDFIIPARTNILQLLNSYIEANKMDESDVGKDVQVLTGAVNKVSALLWDSVVDSTLFNNYRRGVYLQSANNVSGKLKARLPEVSDRVKGYLDLHAGVISTESAMVKRLLVSADEKRKKTMLLEIDSTLNYLRGTFAAGLITEGIEAVRLYSLAYLPGRLGKKETVSNDISRMKKAAAYIKKNNFDVVVITWDINKRNLRRDLAGVYKNDSLLTVKTDSLYKLYGEIIRGIIKENRKTLFVASYTGYLNDLEVQERIPGGFNLDNLLVTGAVDNLGFISALSPAGTAEVYAVGVETLSIIPGGEKLALTGNPVSAGRVGSLAAKILALKPSWDPVKVKETILEYGIISPEEGIVIIDPANTLEKIKK